MRAAGETGPGAERASAGRGTRPEDQRPSSCLPAPRLGYLREPILFCLRLSGGRPPPPFLENPNKMYL